MGWNTNKRKTRFSALVLSLAFGLLTAFGTSANAQAINEGFDAVASLPSAGWVSVNKSQPLGASTWTQCSGTAIPPAQAGASTSCALVNFNSTTGAGTISNWLITPERTISNGDVISFYTRTAAASSFPDRLQLRMSSAGSSSDTGTTATDVGVFTTLLHEVNPTLTVGGYPETWTQVTVTVSGLAAPVQGRFAFRYFVTSGGPSGDNSNIIGLDTLVYTPFGGPTPTPGGPTPTPTPTPAATPTPTPGGGGSTFPGTGVGPIPDGTTCGTEGGPLTVSFAVTGVASAPTSVSVNLTGTHPWVGDIVARLISPDGTTFVVFGKTGSTTAGGVGDSSDFGGPYNFNDAAAGNWWTAATAAGGTVPVPAGDYRTSTRGDVAGAGAQTLITPAFASIPTSNGTWTMTFTDSCPADTGTITAANLTLGGGGGPGPTPTPTPGATPTPTPGATPTPTPGATPTPSGPDAPVDMNGDGRTDYVVVRNVGSGPTGQLRWYIMNAANGSISSYEWGTASDWYVPGDFDGDGKDDVAVWRPGTQSTFYILQSATMTFRNQDFGQTGDDPTIVADYNGDGKDDVAVYREGVNTGDQSRWYFMPQGASYFTSVNWGSAGDVPVSGDFDGDGKADFVFQRAEGGASKFYRLFATGNFDDRTVGQAGDITVFADYDGDGKTDIAVVRLSGGNWQWTIRRSSDQVIVNSTWGSTDDIQVPGDYDGDGKADIAVWRPGSTSTFYVNGSGGTNFTQNWGTATDAPVASYNVR